MTVSYYERISIHLIVIFLIVFLPSLWMYFKSDIITGANNSLLYLLAQAATGIFIFLLPPVYLSIYWLIPKYLMKKRYFLFTVFVFILVGVWSSFVSYFEPWTDEHWFGQPPSSSSWTESVIAVTFFLACTILINLSYRWFRQLSRIKQLENDHLKKEITLLKSQINPHFFFNTLNNLYALSLAKSDDTPRIILMLSELMRYTIYDCKEPYVFLESEIKYLDNYIALQRIRQGDSSSMEFHNSVLVTNVKVAPMIFIVLLENAFKHGVDSMSMGAKVIVDLKVDENTLQFKVENNFQELKNDKMGGLGLKNVNKRLSLLYGKNYSFTTTSKNGWFSAQLKIQHS